MSYAFRLSVLVLVMALSLSLLPGSARAAISASFNAGTLTVSSDGADGITITCAAGNVAVNGANPPGTGAVACAAVTQLSVNGGPGANAIVLSGVSAVAFTTLTSVVVDGGAGADDIQGSLFSDLVLGGTDADTVRPGDGNDTALLGDGADVFVWNPGDDNDVVEGQAGTDVLQFNGSNANEITGLSPNGGRALFTRDVANVLMDLNDVEHVDYRALGGADSITVNSLVGTDVTQVSLRLAGTLGGVTGDALVDQVVVNGGAGVDTLAVDPSVAGTVLATSNATLITISTLEPANDNVTLNGGDGSDTLTVGVGLEGQVGTLNVDGGLAADSVVVRGTSANDSLLVNAVAPIVSSNATALIDTLAAETVRLDGLDGDDTLTALPGVAALFQLVFDGGVGADTVNGGNGADTILGGDGADAIDGNAGNDVVLAGLGDDVLRWDPGDGSDVLEGQAGVDTLSFNASNGSEIVDVFPNGGRVVLLRNIGAVTMDLDDLEQVDVHALGGADVFNLDDLSGTDVTRVRVLLAGTLGGAAGDAAIDAVNIDGTASGDTFALSAASGVVSVVRGTGTVSVHTAEPASDRLTVFGLAGDDSFSVGPGVPSLLGLVLEGGPGTTTPGDTATISGDAVAETYQIAPNAARVALTRSVPLAFAVDLNEVEQLQLQVDAGADTVNTQGLPTTRQILDGGAPSVAPADTLGVAGFTGDALKSPILLPGAAPIVHTGFEQTSNPLVIEAFLTGAQETPPNPSSGRGFGTVTLSPARDAITVFLQYSGLAGNNTLTHIHGPALRRVAAPPIIDLPASGATSGSFTVGPMAVTPAQVSELTTGRWYFNVHSSAPNSSGGEIRGQLDNSMLRDGFE